VSKFPSFGDTPVIGCVSYLNAKPLVFGYPADALILDVPSGLVRRFASGGLNAALLPVFDIFRQGRAHLVDDVSISCRGPVRSVVIASDRPLQDCAEIVADPASVTSNALTQVVLAEFLGNDFPKLVKEASGPNPARVLIGDQALEFRHSHPDWHFLDLGELWFQHVGLPFVFAAWCLNEPVSYALAARLRDTRDLGLKNLETIADSTPDPQDALEYLTRNIRYGLGSDEKRALRVFADLCLRHGLLASAPEIYWT
jgi:chorismate dehydratase